ncbi:hypothetical protein RB195_012189 [Necator americanus]|uniref:Choline/carnitine acyltransferase domain-containing protein n=1 Tax=Necator americanus TaxID=51031 RepID=A0ABR1D635_NECAM
MSCRQPRTHVQAAKLCREVIKEDLKERRAEVSDEDAEAGQSIRYACRNFFNHKTIMTALRTPDGTTIASRREMEKVIHDIYSNLFNSHVHFPPHHLKEDGHVIPNVLPSELRHAIMSRQYAVRMYLDGVRTYLDAVRTYPDALPRCYCLDSFYLAFYFQESFSVAHVMSAYLEDQVIAVTVHLDDVV